MISSLFCSSTRGFAAVLAIGLMAAPAGAATVLTFEPESALGNDLEINDNYGDNVSANVQGGFEYDGEADTPNVTVEYTGLKAYTGSYGDLARVAYLDAVSSVTFTADPGFVLTLNSLDLAGYDGAATLDEITVTGVTSPFAQSAIAAPATGHNTVNVGVTGSTLTLNFADSSGGLVGVSNISFSQSAAAVPEPTAVALVGMAGVGLLARRRRI